MVDYKVFFVVWTSAVLAQCLAPTSTLNDLLNDPPMDLLAFLAGASLLAGMFHNWLWRLVVFITAWTISHPPSEHLLFSLTNPLPSTILCAFSLWMMLHTAPTWYIPHIFRPLQPAEGAVFVTGADSGMGFWTTLQLAKEGYAPIFAGCYTKSAKQVLQVEFAKLCPDKVFDDCITCVSLDVTNDTSVQQARDTVKEILLGKDNNDETYLTAVINCAGLGYNGPAEYFPLELYQKQMDVNFYGYVRVIQAFLPLLKEGLAGDNKKRKTKRRARIVLIGTGGGVLSPGAPLLAAYLAAKWAGEAFAASLRMDLQLTKQPIDVVMLNPGFIKPTALMSVGLKLTKDMWDKCRQVWGHNQAQEEYESLLNKFIEFAANEKGTHVSKVAQVMGEILQAHRPHACYKVGDDSKAAPVVGLLPTYVREFVVKYSMYQQVGST